MSAILNQFLAEANALAEESGFDMNEVVKGGGGARLLPQGWAFAQLVEYVEYGNHAQEFQGKAKDPALEVQLGFALTGVAPDPQNPGQFLPYNNEDGSPYIVRPYPFAISRNEKARAHLLFKALNWKGTAKNFAQLLSQKWLIKIVHEPKSKTDATIVSRPDLKQILPPLEATTGKAYEIADADPSLYKMFLWDRPTKAAWDSLHIEGTWEAKDGKPAQSKNRIQERILSALNFQGSQLQQLLGGAVLALPQTSAAPAATPQPAAPAAAPQAVAPQVAAPLAVPAAASPAVASVAVPSVSVPPHAPAAPVAAPVGVPAPATPAVPQVAVPSSPVLPV